MDFCCDLHGLHCEPPSELCCENCTEFHHGFHKCRGVMQPSHHDLSSCVLDVKKSERNTTREEGINCPWCHAMGLNPQHEHSERNAEPEEEWLEVHQALTAATRWIQKTKVDDIVRLDETVGQLIDAVRGLVLLLEPPSVRERRLNDSEALPELREEDIEVGTWHAAGQRVNEGPRGVTVTHKPSGIFAQAGQHRSQLENKSAALTALRQKLARRASP